MNIIKKNEAKLNSISEDVNKIERQIEVMQLPLQHILLSRLPIGAEIPARHDDRNIWSGYEYLVKRVLYHMKNFIRALKNILSYLDDNKFPENSSVAIPTNIAYGVGFEFESLVSAFYKLIEQPTPDQIKSALSSELRRLFPVDLIKKNNADGFYWRLNILRNRIVHPNVPKYSTNAHNSACRYNDFSSRPMMCELKADNIIFQSTLFDLSENDEIKRIIKSEILEKGDNNKNIIDILFPQNSPKGHEKNSPILLLANINYFNYFSSYFNLSRDMLHYLDNINHLFIQSLLKKCNDNIYEVTLCTYIDGEERKIQINDVFKFA